MSKASLVLINDAHGANKTYTNQDVRLSMGSIKVDKPKKNWTGKVNNFNHCYTYPTTVHYKYTPLTTEKFFLTITLWELVYVKYHI